MRTTMHERARRAPPARSGDRVMCEGLQTRFARGKEPSHIAMDEQDIREKEAKALRPGPATRRKSEPARPATARATVLVVEDDIDMHRFTTQSLSEQYEVISAFDGQE